MWTNILAGFIALLLSVPAAAQPLADVPMHFYGTRPAVEVMVNGRGPYLFLIDTGAEGMARADTGLVSAANLPTIGAALIGDGTSSPPVSAIRVRLDSLSLGRLERRQVDASSRDYNSSTSTYLSQIDGILGLEFFSGHLLTLDFPRRRVIVRAGELPRADGSTILDYTLKHGSIPMITLRFGEQEVPAIIDSGNIRGVELGTGWIRRLRHAGYRRLIGRGASATREFDVFEVPLADELRIGRHRFPVPLVTFSEAFDADDGNVGSTMLRNFAVTIDQRNRRVRFE